MQITELKQLTEAEELKYAFAEAMAEEAKKVPLSASENHPQFMAAMTLSIPHIA